MTPQQCAAQHFGPWMIEPQWFAQAVASVKAGTFKAITPADAAPGAGNQRAYSVVDGIAIVPIAGQMTKGESSFGGTSTVKTRQAMRKAAADDSVRAIMLHIDSPGGTVAGSRELADEVDSIDETAKPVYSHIDDLGASAAYNIAMRSRRITANKSSQVGSIGTMAVLEDTSGAAEKAGVKVHVISTGPNKGAGTDGAPISEDQLAAYQELVDSLGSQFVEDVNRSRGLSLVMGQGAADGRVFIAPQAKQLGLIDGISSFDEAMNQIRKDMQMQDEKLEQAKRDGYAEGVKAGKVDARTELKTFLAAFPGSEKWAADQFALNRTLDEAKALRADIDKATADAAAQIKAKDAEIEKLKAQVGTQGAVGTESKTGEEKSSPDDKYAAIADLDERIETEWSDDHNGCKAKFKVFNAYLGYRKSVESKPAMKTT